MRHLLPALALLAGSTAAAETIDFTTVTPPTASYMPRGAVDTMYFTVSLTDLAGIRITRIEVLASSGSTPTLHLASAELESGRRFDVFSPPNTGSLDWHPVSTTSASALPDLGTPIFGNNTYAWYGLDLDLALPASSGGLASTTGFRLRYEGAAPVGLYTDESAEILAFHPRGSSSALLASPGGACEPSTLYRDDFVWQGRFFYEVLPAAVIPEPMAVLGGAALLGLTLLRRARPSGEMPTESPCPRTAGAVR